MSTGADAIPLLRAVAFDARDPARLARFWAGLLDREVVEDGRRPHLPGEGGQVSLRFVFSTGERVRPNLMHIHLTSTDAADQEAIVASALRHGARHPDVGQLPEEEHVVLEDPEGYEFCVLPPDTTFVQGCGLLGELACDGTREVGVFWSAALAWPLVWDQDQETAIQSPEGGTKVAWGGPPLAPRAAAGRQRLELVPSDGRLVEAVDRLVSLGATRLDAGSDGVPAGGGAVRLTDPDGNELLVISAAIP